ncbi:hypothetical protein D3C76_611790 [compost metagenome]
MSAWHGLREEREQSARLARYIALLFPRPWRPGEGAVQLGRVATIDGRWPTSANHSARRG